MEQALLRARIIHFRMLSGPVVPNRHVTYGPTPSHSVFDPRNIFLEEL